MFMAVVIKCHSYDTFNAKLTLFKMAFFMTTVAMTTEVRYT